MEPHRVLLHPRPSAPPPIPPSSNPSLSTGQAFYTVESLQGATVVPPPQLLPPEPLHFHAPPRILPNDRPFGPLTLPPHPYLERGHPFLGRKPLPPPQLPSPNFAPAMRAGGPGMGPPSPHFMMDPRMPGNHPGREPLRGGERDLRRGFGPSRNVDRNRIDRRLDSGRLMQRPRFKKQGQKAKPVPESKPAPSATTEDEKTPAGENMSTEGGPGWCSVCQIDCFRAKTLKKHFAGKKHKRQLEIVSGQGEEPKKSDGEEQVMKEVEIADVVNPAAKETVNEETDDAAKEEEENEQSETADTPRAATTVAGKKRASHDNDGMSATRKRSKSTASTDAQNATVVVANVSQDNENSKMAEMVTSVVEVCELCNVTCPSKAVLETHLKGKKHAARVKKGTNTSKGKNGIDEGKEPVAEGELKPPELVKGGEEGANVTGELSNGIIGQFAQVQ